ncbi:MAG TPA: A/G-specific adenine glycosylase [Nitrospirales bacterium]|nr:A/G-specific adenine glycosylase [Nitrospira sp. MA-1]HNP59566.1 A/G-specific adenine glycosylase [Nitrospirales bacterium]
MKKITGKKKSNPSVRVVYVIPKTKKAQFQKRLLAWYGEFGRDLPWRRTSDPYKILVSEVMLQQTQVDRVIPKFHEFLGKYPTLQDLAEAQPEDVRKTWYPLGYNIRPYRLQGIACETIERYGGAIPHKPEELLSLKGIGRYTAGAIRSFAFNKDAPILDTNVMRVLHRIFIGKGEAKKQKAELWLLSEKLIPRGKGYDFNQALMDFGAMVCTARKPICLLCPMRNICLTVSLDEK